MNPVAQARLGALATMLMDLAEGDIETAADAAKADELDSAEDGYLLLKLPEEKLRELGWRDHKQVRRALDAKKCEKDAPYYLKMSQRRTELRFRDNKNDNTGEQAKGYAIPVPVIVRDKPPAGHALPPQYDPEDDER